MSNQNWNNEPSYQVNLPHQGIPDAPNQMYVDNNYNPTQAPPGNPANTFPPPPPGPQQQGGPQQPLNQPSYYNKPAQTSGFGKIFNLEFANLSIKTVAPVVFIITAIGLGVYWLFSIMMGFTEYVIDREYGKTGSVWTWLFPLLGYPAIFLGLLGILKVFLSFLVKHEETNQNN